MHLTDTLFNRISTVNFLGGRNNDPKTKVGIFEKFYSLIPRKISPRRVSLTTNNITITHLRWPGHLWQSNDYIRSDLIQGDQKSMMLYDWIRIKLWTGISPFSQYQKLYLKNLWPKSFKINLPIWEISSQKPKTTHKRIGVVSLHSHSTSYIQWDSTTH